jgi:hypothetical protein
MSAFRALRLHDSAPHPADRRDVSGTTRAEVLDDAFAELGPGYYVRDITHVESRQVVWTEGGRWSAAADTILPE